MSQREMILVRLSIYPNEGTISTRHTIKRSLRGSDECVLVSPHYQVAIPKVVREALKLQPGQRLQVIQYQKRIELVPLRPVKSARGFRRGIAMTIEREEERL